MTFQTMATQISLPWSLEVSSLLRIALALLLLIALWPRKCIQPMIPRSDRLLINGSLMMTYWVLSGILLLFMHLFNALTVLGMAALPRILSWRRSVSPYQLGWGVQMRAKMLDILGNPQLIRKSLPFKQAVAAMKKLWHSWRFDSGTMGLVVGCAIGVSLWIRLNFVLQNAAPAYRNGIQNLAWVGSVVQNQWVLGSNPIPLGFSVLLAEIEKIGFVNPLMLEKLAAAVVFLVTLAGIAAVIWAMTQSAAALLGVVIAYGVFSQFLPAPIVRDLAVGPAAVGLMGLAPGFWLMYQVMRTGRIFYGVAALSLTIWAGIMQIDAGALVAMALFIGWLAALLAYHIPWRRTLLWAPGFLLAWGVSWGPMAVEKLITHHWVNSTSAFAAPLAPLLTPTVSLFEWILLIGALLWLAIRIWIDDFGASLGVVLLLVVSLGMQERSLLLPWHLMRAGSRQMLGLTECLAIGGIITLIMKDLVDIGQTWSVLGVFLMGMGFATTTGIRPVTAYTLHSDSFFAAYEMIEKNDRPYGWIAVSNGGSALVSGYGYHLDPLQWANQVVPKGQWLAYRSHNGTQRPISQSHIFFWVERYVHPTPLSGSEFTAIRDEIGTTALQHWLLRWQAGRPHSLDLVFQSPQLSVYELSRSSAPPG